MDGLGGGGDGGGCVVEQDRAKEEVRKTAPLGAQRARPLYPLFIDSELDMMFIQILRKHGAQPRVGVVKRLCSPSSR